MKVLYVTLHYGMHRTTSISHDLNCMTGNANIIKIKTLSLKRGTQIGEVRIRHEELHAKLHQFQMMLNSRNPRDHKI